MRKITSLKALADSQIREKAMGHLQEISNTITIKEKREEKQHWEKYNACL